MATTNPEEGDSWPPNTWFGEPWPSADRRVGPCEDDTLRVPVPVGQTCLSCEEQITADDRGVMTWVLESFEKPLKHRPQHAECQLRAITGNLHHVTGQCRHVGDCTARSDLSYREEARQVWEHFHGPLAPAGSPPTTTP